MRILTLFAHYDPKNLIASHIVFHLRALRKISSDVVFITNSNPSSVELEKLSGIVSDVVVQPENVGFDFYAWSTYLKANRRHVESYDALLLTNSSIIGPLFPLQPIVDRMKGYAYWGMTDSYQLGYHLQSYFLFFQKEIFSSQYFWGFFENIIPFPSVSSVIQAYETNLTMYFSHYFGPPGVVADSSLSFLRRRYIKILSFCKESSESWVLCCKQYGIFKYLETRESINPCFYFPNELIAQKFPYVKVKLLKNNIHNRNLAPILEIITKNGLDVSEIQ